MRANITQNSKKNVAVIVAVSLVFGIMIGLGIQTTDAQQYVPQFGDRDVRSPMQVMDIEEDDRIGEIDRNDSAAPNAELISIEKYKSSSNNRDATTYKIIYRLTAGQENLQNIQIRAVTDLGVWNYETAFLNADTSSINVVRIKALDPDSITGEIIGYTIRE